MSTSSTNTPANAPASTSVNTTSKMPESVSTSSPTKQHFIIGTAGHIDHGKSTLVKALTGSDPDRLQEEKRRGITIELGFAELNLPGNIVAGIVDVPGHEKFIRQMIAGASGIDIALVCIAADDGIMPQTREHLAVLQLLDVTTCVIALTKCDTVDSDWLELVQEEIRSELNSTPFKNAPIVCVSAYDGTGLDELKATLSACAQNVHGSDSLEQVRMPVDRVFTIKGAGTVVTGTLWQGTIKVDDELEVLPQKRTTRVRAIQVHDKEVPSSTPGTRTALNLSGLSKQEIHPGDFLASPNSLQLSDRFDAQFTYTPILSARKPLLSGTQVHIAHGTREVMGRILFMNRQDSVEPNETVFAQIRLDSPLPLSRSDHFVVRLLSPARVIGGGKVLNPYPHRRTTLTAEDSNLLDALAQNDKEQICAAIVDASNTPVSIKEIQRISGYSAESITKALANQTSGKGKPLYLALESGSECYYARKPIVQKLVMTLENTLLSFHANNPKEIGISKGALEQLYPQHLEQACFEAILKEALAQQKVVIQDGKISHPKASAGARNLEAQAAQTLGSILSSYGATPPALSALFDEAGLDATKGSQALLALEKQGKAQRVSKTLCFSQDALDELWLRTKTYLKEYGSGSAAELKEAMGTSRKYAIPLLEYFDSQKMTVRQQDLRTLPKSHQ